MSSEDSASGIEPPGSISVIALRVPHHPPRWTYGILVVNGLAFLLSLAVGRNLVLLLGAKINQAILLGEWWRLLTAVFLHVDILHILFNSYALYAFGTRLESLYSPWRYLALYTLSGISGSALSFALSPRASVGASGAIFGLIGGLAAYYYRYRKQMRTGSRPLTNLVTIALYNLLYGFVVPGIDNWGHLGGLLAGLVMGWFFAPAYRVVYLPESSSLEVVDIGSWSRWWQGMALVGAGIVLACLGGLLRWR